MCECKTNMLEATSKCCTLLRGPKKIILQTRSNACRMNFNGDGAPQFEPVILEEGEKTVEIYECHNVPGYKSVYVTVVSQKE